MNEDINKCNTFLRNKDGAELNSRNKGPVMLFESFLKESYLYVFERVISVRDFAAHTHMRGTSRSKVYVSAIFLQCVMGEILHLLFLKLIIRLRHTSLFPLYESPVCSLT